MMMVVMTGYLPRVSTSRILQLLLLLATTSHTPLVQRAGAYSSELTSAPATGYTTDGTTGTTTSTTTADAPVTTSDTTEDAATEAPAVITDDDDADGCSAELAACLADTTCQSCLSASSSSAATEACRSFNSLTTSSGGCEVNLDAICCLDDLSDFDCRGNDEYLAFATCILEDNDCVVGEITCDGDEGEDEDEDESTTETDGAATGTFGLGNASITTSLLVTLFSCAFIWFSARFR